jgi:quercetin dioxygenase-like cupin family protein
MTAVPGRFVVIDDVAPVSWTVEQGRFLLRAEHTAGALSLIEFITPAGAGPPRHLHAGEDETFIVTSGRYEFLVGDESVVAGPGTVLFGPRGVSHGFRNLADTPSTMLCVVTPGGAERSFEGLIDLLNRASPPGRDEIHALGAAYGISYPPGPGYRQEVAR